MTLKTVVRSIAILVVSAVAVVFGLLTIKAGGSVLFGDSITQRSAGSYVPFVLWFNFFAGFIYLVAGVGLFLQKQWAAWMSIIIFVATITVFVLFGLHVINGGMYEARTVGAMSLRTTVWALIALVASRKITLK